MERINYLEYPAKDLAATKQFFYQVFNWQFTDFGEEYSAFDKSAGLDGGFYQADLASSTATGACLTVFYSEDLQQCQDKVVKHGGKIIKAIFPFPGGRRFHFTEPSGNEFAVWSDK